MKYQIAKIRNNEINGEVVEIEATIEEVEKIASEMITEYYTETEDTTINVVVKNDTDRAVYRISKKLKPTTDGFENIKTMEKFNSAVKTAKKTFNEDVKNGNFASSLSRRELAYLNNENNK